MPFIELAGSEHAPGVRPVAIHYREMGKKAGRTVVFLHGGWGYAVYPIDAQVAALGDELAFVVPDRSGYGRSTSVAGELPSDFHRRAAEETIAILDALGIARPVIWGHSDGAVIGAMIGLAAPERIAGLVLEAFHFYRDKPNSRRFFERFTARPRDLGAETQRLLEADHGPGWPRIVERNCGAWIRIGRESARGDQDLYGGRLGQLRVPTLFLHGTSDPRTEPDELDRVRKAAPQAQFSIVDGQHSPHSENRVSTEVNAILRRFVRAHARDGACQSRGDLPAR